MPARSWSPAEAVRRKSLSEFDGTQRDPVMCARGSARPATCALPVASPASPRIIKPAAGSAHLSAPEAFDLRPVQERVAQMVAAAQKAVDDARAEVERIHQEGRQEGIEAGRAAGLEQGRLEGIERGLAEAAEIRKTLVALIEDLQRRRAALNADAEAHLAELAVAIAKRIVKTRIELDRDVVTRNVAAALELVAAAEVPLA